MYSLEIVNANVTDFTDEILAKMQNVEPEKLKEYYHSINESATESAKTVKNGMKTMFAKLLANVFEEESVHTPLMIDLVVRNVLQYLPMTDLCSCRQVCRLWNQEASAYFRRKQKIIFYPESIQKMETFISFMQCQEKAQAFADLHLQSDPENLNTTETNYLKKCQPEPPPYSIYCFTAQYPTTQFSRILMQDFVNICGQYIKKLEIFYPDDGALSAQDFKAFFLAGMPNLESIHLVNLPRRLTRRSFLKQPESLRQMNCINNNEDKDNYIKTNELLNKSNYSNLQELSAVTHLRIDRTWKMETSWKEPFLQDLMSLMPNLLDYELWTWNSTTEDEHSKPYLVSLSSQNKKSLKILRPGSIGDNLGVTIAQLGLTLKKLYLPVLNRNVSAKTIEFLLQSQHGTLEEFQLNCSTMQDSRLILFPRMGKLTILQLIIAYPWNNDYTTFTPPINYETQFPLLKLLKLELAIYNDFGFISYFFPGIGTTYRTICPTLEELDISFSGFRDEKFITNVAGIFPNIARLKLDGYGSKIFSSICLHMQNLEDLDLYLIYGFNVDDQMTGIPKETCAKMRKSEGRMLDDFKLDEVQLYPSLGSLHKLKALAIRQKDYQAKFWPDAQCITNVTAYFSLAHMKHLRHLRVESVKFTEDCRQYLSQVLEDCWLDFT